MHTHTFLRKNTCKCAALGLWLWSFSAMAAVPQDLSPSGRNEYTIMTQSVSPNLRDNPNGGSVDANCRVGANQSGWSGSFNQRGAMDRLLAGIFSGNLAYIEDGVCAVEETFRHQQGDGSIDGLGKDIFWMSWQNHALWVLQQSPYWNSAGVRPADRNYGGGQFSARINALRPAMVSTMNYLANQSASLRSSDANSPNRTMINAVAYMFGTLLLNGVASEENRAQWLSEGKWWIDNEFDQAKTSSYGVLFRDFDGIAAEHGGYDTGYNATTLWFFTKLAIHFNMPTADGWDRLEKGLRWLHMRILADGTVDCTFNTRSGPNNQVGDAKSTNMKELLRGLWYPAAFLASVGRTAETTPALEAAQRAGTSVNGLPPKVFSPPVVNARVGQPLNHTVLATNAGATSLSLAFSLTVNEGQLPPGLAVGPISFTKSTGHRTISGTPTAAGSYQVSVQAGNEYGSSPTQTLIINVSN